MVIPCAAAVHAAGVAGTAGATALGLGMGKTDLELTRDLFKLQMQQSKRLWTADWAEASVRHGEACMQSAQQHSEAQAMATASFFQSEKLASQSIKLARDQDSRSYEMGWRAEVREALRDELSNQNNRFNIIMLCDTVCLSCVFSLVADGNPPEDTSPRMLQLYVLSLGVSVTLFSISLWCTVIVVRRLYDHTASILERKLFVESPELQKVWQYQLEQNLPTGPDVMYLVNQAYEKWVSQHLNLMGNCSIQLMSIGVVSMFITAGIFVHVQYHIGYNAPITTPLLFWIMIIFTSCVVLFMKFTEDRKEKKKEGVYNVSWQDKSSMETGPYAKITKVAGNLFTPTAVNLGSTERMESLSMREKMERDYCAKTKSLYQRVEALREDSEQRSKTRKDILQILTTAAEELESLPEELTSRLNKVLHDIDKADGRTAQYVSMQSENMLAVEGVSQNWNRLPRMPSTNKVQMDPNPVDAQRIPVSLDAVRKKLGEISLTTFLRIRNTSNETLRLQSGVQLKSGKYIKSINARDRHNNVVSYHLYPGTTIPPRTEIVMAARSGGGWVPTSGIQGEIVYSNEDETWLFRINFSNELLSNVRKCKVHAFPAGGSQDESDQYWQISKEEYDHKANNEFVITLNVLRGEEAAQAADDFRQSQVPLKDGFLWFKDETSRTRLHWQRMWFGLTATEMFYAPDSGSDERKRIAFNDITAVQQSYDLVTNNAFEIHTSLPNNGLYKLAADTPEEREEWIKMIISVIGPLNICSSVESATSNAPEPVVADALDGGIECVQSSSGTEVLPSP